MKSSSGPNKHIHFIAICGTGMGSLAGLFQAAGWRVTGSDAAVYPPMSTQLAALGIAVRTGYRPEHLEPRPDAVVIGNAVSRDNPEAAAALARGLPYFSMPQATWEFFLQDRFPLVVAGTHGKTTTSGLLAWILERAGRSPSFLVGGILKNFDRSFQLGQGDDFVIEGDEYDSAFFDKGPKFLHYRPQILLLNAVEFDHADIYRDLEHLMGAFRQLIRSLDPRALLIADATNPNVRQLIAEAPCRVVTCMAREGPAIGGSAELEALDLRYGEKTTFTVHRRGTEWGQLASPLPGRHNVQNLLAALAAADELGLSLADVQAALDSFAGLKRRQEVFAEIDGITLIDDFAHHPTAVAETLAALRGRYPGRRLWAVFEPRSNTSQRRIFQEAFAAGLQGADEVLLAPLHRPEKFAPEARLDPEQVAATLRAAGRPARAHGSVDAIVADLAERLKPGDVVCFMSNGGFGDIYAKIAAQLKGG